MIHPPPPAKVSLAQFWRDRRGVGAAEYALVIAMIATVLFSYVGKLGSVVGQLECGMAKTLGGIAVRGLGDGGQLSPCYVDTCTGAAVGAICQRLWSNGDGLDTVVVAQVNTLYAWPSDESPQYWNNGTANYPDVLSPDYGTAAAALADMTGMSETNTLIGLTGSATPYAAATACRAHGPDWYLPAYGELNIVTAAAGASGVGSLMMNTTGTAGPPYYGYYWSASEKTGGTGAWVQYYSAGWLSNDFLKHSTFAVRCVRR